MDKKETRRQLVEMLEGGRSKTETFKALSGGAVKDRVLAAWIAGRPDPALRDKHSLKVTLLVVLTCIQAFIGSVAGFFLFYDASAGLALTMLLIAGGIPLLFAWCFYKNVAAAYTVYIILTISQVSRMFKGYEEDPVSTVIGVVITLAMVFYAAWVKSLLFPDLALIGPKKIKGQFVFSN
ncbi:hypothetical protein SAMN04488483_0532 [Pseudomonas helmanticensis]|uniref:Uncharacterized protein n=1 Tax=Pseudomonas helmanticensis TaxID=1471381 RepID=A0ACD2U063_9PSED|nr:hypothetical protein [Pseudomonas helmanticensis]SMQ22743.1 hypothetical protein SAMN04488483_0532 [Pseudomonas helmanticensis]